MNFAKLREVFVHNMPRKKMSSTFYTGVMVLEKFQNWQQFLLDGQIISKTCFLMFIHLPLSLKYLIKCFPSMRSPKFLIFAQTLVSCYNLAIFWLGLCFALLDPFPSLNLWDSTFPCFLTSLPTPKNFLKNLEARYPLHSASFRQNPLFHTSG